MTRGYSERSEHKPGSVALHWRGMDAPEIRQMREQIEPKWSLIAEGWGLCLNEFDGGLELRVPGRNKGHAVETILDEMGEGAAAAYLGDDATDEDAFRSIKGKGLGILVRERLRPTVADIWIRPPEELLDLLTRWSQTGG